MFSSHRLMCTHRHADDGALVAFKYLEIRSFVHIPTSDGEIRTSGKQDSPSGVDRHTGHSAFVTFHDLYDLSSLEVPGPGREVSTSGDEDVVRGVQVHVVVLLVLLRGDEDERINPSFVAAEHPHTLP